MPIIKVFSEQSGGSFVALATLTIFALHIAMLTPAASPYAAILYGNSSWVDRKDIVRYGAAIILMIMALFTVIGIPLAKIFY
jgi:sodium-dependent dicarboxylate transporter 2/3/5